MKIVRINKIDNGGKLNAFFDMQTDDGIIIKGFRIVNGSNGIFVSPPDEKGKDGKYYETVVMPKDMKEKLQKLAVDEYNKIAI